MISGKIQTLALIVFSIVMAIVLFIVSMKAFATQGSRDVLQNNVVAMVHKNQDASYRRNTGSFYLNKTNFESSMKTRVATQASLVILPDAKTYNDIKTTMSTGTKSEKDALLQKYNNSTLGYLDFDYLPSENGDAESLSGVKVALYQNTSPSVSDKMVPKRYMSRYVVSPRADNRDSKDVAQYQKTIVKD